LYTTLYIYTLSGGWGKPPVNENGNPLYGDVFGTDYDGFKTEEELGKCVGV